MLAALYISGRLVTGLNHGDAFSKLSEAEQDSQIQSGFIDTQTMKFLMDDKQFYLKQIIMLRHGDSEGRWESPITDLGRCQANRAAAFLLSLDLHDYYGFCSPAQRCRDTAAVIEETCHIHFETDDRLCKQNSFENNDDFVYRVGHTLDTLPEKSVLISHCDFIRYMTQLALGAEVTVPPEIPNCSATYIDNHRAVWVARNVVKENPC